MNRRDFLGGALVAGAAAAMPDLSAFASTKRLAKAWLHLAQDNTIHTFASDPDSVRLLGSTQIEDLAAIAPHPRLPILYVARDCPQWKHLPRGVVATYAVESSSQPLRLIAETPLALSSTGPRSLAVSACGRSLIVAASTGRAWNALTLGEDGIPAPVAITRKDAGTAPHGVVFSPQELFAIGVDPARERLTLLQPSSNGLNLLARIDAPLGLAAMTPAWTPDGKHLIAADRYGASLSAYAVDASSGRIEHMQSVAIETPVQSLRTLFSDGGITLRAEENGSRLELWRMVNEKLHRGKSRALPQRALSLATSSSQQEALWLATEDRLLCLSSLQGPEMHSVRVPRAERNARVSLTHQPIQRA